MFNFIYKKVLITAMNRGFIKKRNAVYLYNILVYNRLTCEICKKPINKRNKRLKASIDHKLPISKGGDESFNNLCIAHRYCNCKKGDNYKKFRY